MLVNLKTILKYAEDHKSAVGSFNVYNLESILAVIDASQELNEPVIISFGEGYISHAPIEVIAAIVKKLCSTSSIPVVLHLDHAKEFSTVMRAIRCGFTSVMYDGSYLPLAENISNTRKIVDIAHAIGVSVEGELGYMNNEDGTSEKGFELEKGYTSVSASTQYVTGTGIDALAVAIGNAHGIYKGTPELDFERLSQISTAIGIPVVLHGCSGIPAEAIKKAVSLGVRKINVNTEISTGAVREARDFLESHTEKNTRFETMLKAAQQTMSETVKNYIKMLKEN
ncbi:class II fructose-bisphosphate aldolase [Anaerosinus massiliensis]|uniref:class II fructose-bisphosphate aldolase n=1 Tax=Massilibacillus massiliensis TaxID=1806837 RepID=UPI000A87F877|nr:class II fructose-bisphosphate aldolase [Massilibacillus massiliensis]